MKILSSLFIVLAAVVPVIVGLCVFHGITGLSDNPKPEAIDLANQVAGTTQYLLTLGTAVIGLVGFLMSEKVSGYWHGLTTSDHRSVLTGIIIVLLSLWTGLMALVSVLWLSRDAGVVIGLPYVLTLSFMQVLELALGFGIIGWTVWKRSS
jgi:hypothetical protein